jgi:superfamily II DNA/RNA helicase
VTYVHRAGRTARYNTAGESLLVLLPQEEAGMLKQLHAHKVPITKIEASRRLGAMRASIFICLLIWASTKKVMNPENNKAYALEERPVPVHNRTVRTPKLSNISARSGEVQCCGSVIISLVSGSLCP